MALRFNNASTRAPQAILLAVSPNPAQAWTTTTLVDVLRETLMLDAPARCSRRRRSAVAD